MCACQEHKRRPRISISIARIQGTYWPSSSTVGRARSTLTDGHDIESTAGVNAAFHCDLESRAPICAVVEKTAGDPELHGHGVRRLLGAH